MPCGIPYWALCKSNNSQKLAGVCTVVHAVGAQNTQSKLNRREC